MQKNMILPILLLSCCLCGCQGNDTPSTQDTAIPVNDVTSTENSLSDNAVEPPEVSVSLTDHYRTHMLTAWNQYDIDENQTLWASGYNEYGQLGQGTQDSYFHSEPVKMAEDVIHVDASRNNVVIYLTSDHKLYGCGNAGRGSLQQHATINNDDYENGHDSVTSPILLMEHVSFACCGEDDIVCLADDGTLWTFGAVNYRLGSDNYYNQYPKQILDQVVYVTGGAYNHAALRKNGEVWTWGNNQLLNCGIDAGTINEPVKVADDAIMIQTDFRIDPMADLSDYRTYVNYWTGLDSYEKHYTTVEEDAFSPQSLANTVIQKSDGSYWVCGEHVGDYTAEINLAEGSMEVTFSGEFQRISKK